MGMLKFTVPHSLDKAQAKSRMEHLAKGWAGKYGIAIHWEGERARFEGKVMGVKLVGHFDVTDSAIAGEATDPGFLLRDKALSYLREKISHALKA